MRRLLVLRPEPGASTTVERARQLGLDVFAVPLFEIEPLSWKLPDEADFDALLLTSANAARMAGEKRESLRRLPAYAVGEATAEAARDAGLDVAAVGACGVDHLLSSIPADQRLLHLCGEDRREPAAHGRRIAPVPVYRAKPVERPNLSGATGAVALVHSPRAGRRFAELMDERDSIAIAAISAAAADAVGQGWETVEAAPQPNDDALLALAARLCNTSAPK
jgi:uroporphyrinogen-III synthase